MPPRIFIRTPVHRCADLSVASFVQRLAAASLSTSAPLSAPPRQRSPPSSGASFLDLDRDFGRQAKTSSSPSTHSSRAAGSPTSAPTFTSRRSDASEALSRVLFDSEVRRRMHAQQEEMKRSALEKMAERKVSDDYVRQMPRRWQAGEVYSPRDLSPEEAQKWRGPARTTTDVIDVLGGFDPRDEYRNFAMISEFTTPTGRIKPASETGLRSLNQRRMARAIRRAIGLGLHPSVHRHPEILSSELTSLPRQNFGRNNKN